MTYEEMPLPEPKEVDEQNWMVLQHMMERAVLKGEPYQDEKCDNCMYYLDPDRSISYCWHQQIRILVGGEWWCQWWETIPEA